jgi:hypothetical protein
MAPRRLVHPPPWAPHGDEHMTPAEIASVRASMTACLAAADRNRARVLAALHSIGWDLVDGKPERVPS